MLDLHLRKDQEQIQNAKKIMFMTRVPAIICTLFLLHPYNVFLYGGVSNVSGNRLIRIFVIYVLTSNKSLAVFILSILVAFWKLGLTNTVIPSAFLLLVSTLKPYRMPVQILYLFFAGILVYSVLFRCYFVRHENILVENSVDGKWEDFFVEVGPGLSWYLFLEVFKRFDSYFKFVFMITPIILTLPIWYKLQKNHIMFIVFSLSVFVHVESRVSFFMYVIPTIFIFPFVRRRCYGGVEYFLTFGLSITSMMLPIMFYKWLYSGTGNANYVYNQNLAFNMFYIILYNNYISY